MFTSETTTVVSCLSGGIHNFEPRYDRKFPPIKAAHHFAKDQLESLKEDIYLCDICTHCGKKVNKD